MTWTFEVVPQTNVLSAALEHEEWILLQRQA
jgi:hypothetical protein